MLSKTSAETQNTGKSTTGGKCTDGHAEVTRRRRAVLFNYVAPGGTVCWQYNPTAYLLPEIHHLSVGNTFSLAQFLHHYPNLKHQQIYADKSSWDLLY